MNERLFRYVRGMWYESKCKNYDEIRRIIKEEVDHNPGMDFKKLGLKILRRCKSELD